MKLLTYHVENYGAIQGVDGNFAEGLVCFCERNGYGKTTLASFLKAMFYGLPSYTVASKTFNDRQHFYPFSGGKFGGNVTFEANGKVYRIERFFDKKSATGDEMKAYCNGVVCDFNGEEPGKALFGLDEEAFVKTVFITANEIEISSTQGINEKLNRTLEGLDGETADMAVETLEKAQLRLKAKRGSGGLLNEKKAEIRELEARLHNLKELELSLDAAYAEREKYVKEIGLLEETERAENEAALLAQKWETYDATALQMERKAELLRQYQEKYPHGAPTPEARARLASAVEERNRFKGVLSGGGFDADKTARLDAYERRFAGEPPTQDRLVEAQKEIVALGNLETERERLCAVAESDSERKLWAKFSAGTPTKEQMDATRLLVDEYHSKYNQVTQISSAALSAAQTSPRKKTNKTTAGIFALAFLLCVVGGLLCAWNATVGCVVVAVGFLMAFVGIISLKSKVNATLPPANANITLLSLQGEMRALEEKIRALTVPYGYYGQGGAAYDFTALEEDLRVYERLIADAQEREKRLAFVERERLSLREKLAAFLSAYGENGADFQRGLQILTAAVSEYRALQADNESVARKKVDLEEKIQALEKELLSFSKEYALPFAITDIDGLKALESDCETIRAAEKEWRELQNDLLEFKEKNGLRERPEKAVESDFKDLRARLRDLRTELASCEKRIEEDERQVERLSEAESELSIAKEQMARYEEKYALYADTAGALRMAEQRLKDKYIAPIKQRFSHYAEALEKALGEKISMDQNFHVVFERGGENRSERHLSAGERSLCALCLRLALLDNMYGEEQPFVIMDDPFVHLDEAHLRRTATLVKELAKDRQILYFCCHESRKM